MGAYRQYVLATGLKDCEKTFKAFLLLTDKEFRELPEQMQDRYVEKMFLYRFAAKRE